MPVIKIKNQPINFNRILAFGCSHTEGTELADAKYSSYTEEELDNLKRTYDRSQGVTSFYQNHISMPYSDLILEHNKLSWPNWIGKEYNVPVVNYGKAGSSNEEIYYTIRKLLLNNLIQDTDLLLVGITGHDRIFFIDEKENQISSLYGYVNTWPDKILYERMVKIKNDNYTLWRYYRDLTCFDMLSKLLNNRLIGVYTFCNIKDWGDEFKKNVSYSNKLILDDIDKMDFILDNRLTLLHLSDYNSKNNHGFSHAKIKFHKKFAKIITEIINGNIQADKSILGLENYSKNLETELLGRDPYVHDL